MTLFLLSLIAGVLTVLAPCVLPLLPVIVGGSMVGEEGRSIRRAFTITISLGVSVILFTLLLKVSTAFIMVPESVWQFISGGIIIIFGIISLFPNLWEKMSLTGVINQKSNSLLKKGYERNSFFGDVIMGAALGPVFSACSPTYFVVLATVIPQNFAVGLVYLLAYTFGLCLSLLFISLIGQRILEKIGLAGDPRGYFKRGLGIIFIVLGLLIMSGLEKKIEVKILDSGFLDITKVEQVLLQLHK